MVAIGEAPLLPPCACGCYRCSPLLPLKFFLGAIYGSFYYHEDSFGAIGVVLYCHQVRLGARGEL